MSGGREQPAGPVVDGLGATLTLADGDLVASVLVIAKVVDADGEVSLCLGCGEGMSWLDRLGGSIATAAGSRTTSRCPHHC